MSDSLITDDDDVRFAFVNFCVDRVGATEDEALNIFRLWLSSVRADAWDKGYLSAPPDRNPYRTHNE
jgi:hypothetical protein